MEGVSDEPAGEVMDEVRKVDCRVREAVERDAVGGEFDVATRDVETCGVLGVGSEFRAVVDSGADEVGADKLGEMNANEVDVDVIAGVVTEVDDDKLGKLNESKVDENDGEVFSAILWGSNSHCS